MNRAQLHASYMAAHILASTGVRVDAAWSADDLLMAFSILPAPRVSFELWCERLAPARNAPAQMTEQEIIEHNEKADRAFGTPADATQATSEPGT